MTGKGRTGLHFHHCLTLSGTTLRVGVLCDQFIRDRIVVGILNAQLSEKLQLDSDLTLERVTQVRQSESVKRQQERVELKW